MCLLVTFFKANPDSVFYLYYLQHYATFGQFVSENSNEILTARAHIKYAFNAYQILRRIILLIAPMQIGFTLNDWKPCTFYRELVTKWDLFLTMLSTETENQL